jgi:hypothetical protein
MLGHQWAAPSLLFRGLFGWVEFLSVVHFAYIDDPHFFTVRRPGQQSSVERKDQCTRLRHTVETHSMVADY